MAELTLDQKKAIAMANARKRAAAKENSYDNSYLAQGMSGVTEGAANLLSLPSNLAEGVINTALKAGPAVANKLLGTDLQGVQLPKGVIADPGESFRNLANGFGAIKEETNDAGKQAVRRVGQEVGASLLPGVGAASLAAKPAQVGASMLASAVGSGTGAAAANHFFPDNPLAEVAGQVAGGIAPNLVTAMLRRGAAKTIAPSVDELKNAAKAKYDEAGTYGTKASQQQTQQLSSDILDIAKTEGLITPTGRVAKSYPKITDAMNMVGDFSKGDMTVEQMGTVRRILQNAARSSDGSEARIGTIMLKKFDDFTAGLAPQLADARGIYQRAAKGDMIDTVIELAGSKAGQFSGSGFENALRTEFRALDRKIIKGQLKGLSDPEVAAIKKVANGGSLQNFFRFMGKAAPTGVVSFAGAGGVPFMIGNAVGGPGLGAAAAGTTMGAGIVGREIATKIGANNANVASALVRRGAEVSGPLLAKDQSKLIAAMLAAQTSNQTPKW